MTSNNLEFSEKISLLTELGKSNSIQDKDKKKIYDVDRHLVSSFGAWWNKDWEKTFKTDDQKIFLLKGLILLEKINGGGGSASLNIMVFAKVHDLGLDSPELVNWVLSNKSRNPYTPFGGLKFSHLKTHTEYLEFSDSERRRIVRRDIRLKVLEKTHEENRKKRKIHKSFQHHKKLEDRKKRNNQNIKTIKTYFNNRNNLLKDIIEQKLPFPLNLVPLEELEKLESKISKMDLNQTIHLIEQIPRKSPEHIKELRKKLINHKNIKLTAE